MRRLTFPGRRAGVVMLLAAASAAAGCAGRPVGDVSGTVTFRGRPVVWGTVVVIAADDMPYHGTIQPDGTFTVRKVPAGTARIGVISPDPRIEPRLTPEQRDRLEELRKRAGVETQPKPPKGAWFRIPDKYADPAKSGLTGEVVSPAVTIDCKLQ